MHVIGHLDQSHTDNLGQFFWQYDGCMKLNILWYANTASLSSNFEKYLSALYVEQASRQEVEYHWIMQIVTEVNIIESNKIKPQTKYYSFYGKIRNLPPPLAKNKNSDATFFCDL